MHAFILVELQRWAALFPAEQRYQQALLEHLSQVTPPASCGNCSAGHRPRRSARRRSNRIDERDPARFQDLAQAALRKQSLAPGLAA